MNDDELQYLYQNSFQATPPHRCWVVVATLANLTAYTRSEDEIMTRVKPFSKLTIKQKFFVVILPLIFAIYTPIAEIISFVRLAGTTGAISGATTDAIVINANWDSNPIVDVKLAASTSAKCESGYEELKKSNLGTVSISSLRNQQVTGEWPGAVKMCKCGTQGDSATSCSQNYDPSTPKNTAGCKGWKIQNKKNVSHIYKDSTGSQCTAEAVKAGCTTIGSETAQLLNVFPSVSAGATQPAANYGYKNGKRICVKRGKVKYSALASVDTNTSVINKCPADAKQCGNICYPKSEGACPLKSFSIVLNSNQYAIRTETLSAVSGGDPLVDLILSPGIPCWKSPAKTDGFTKPIAQKAPNNKADESAKGRCQAKDTRYKAAGTVAQFDLFNTNAIGKPKANVVDYRVYNTFSSDGGKWTLYNREGIQWSRDCIHKKAEFVSVSEKIGTLKASQEAALIVQGIFGLVILGIFFPIMAAMQFFEKDQDLVCIPGQGLEERRNLGVCKSICSFCAILLKLIFIGMASGAAEPVYKVYDGVADCAVDKLTKETVSFITPAVKKIHSGNQTAQNIAYITLAFCVLNWLYQLYGGCKVDKTLADEEDPGIAIA